MESRLLRQTEKLLAVRGEQRRRSGGNFNIFSILGMESKEIQAHSRFLYELLLPAGSHSMGDKFLREFFAVVLHAEYPEDGSVQVMREYAFDGGRIDLLIRNSKFCYPIEVKIDAGDQPLQVRRYAEFAAACAEDSRVFYLTLDGHEPAGASTGGKPVQALSCLSFGGEIRRWLIWCGEAAWSIPAVSEAIRQYIQLIDKLTNRLGDEYMDMLQNMVGGSRASFESALAIADAVPRVKADLIRRIFSGIEKHVNKYMPVIFSDYDEYAERYYTKKRGENYPCLTFSVAKCDGYTLVMEFMIEWKLYYSFFLVNETLEGQWDLSDRVPELFPEVERQVFQSSFQLENSWWRYLPPTADSSLLPDFKNCNTAYRKMFDQDQFQAVMDQIYKELDWCIALLQRAGLCDTILL